MRRTRGRWRCTATSQTSSGLASGTARGGVAGRDGSFDATFHGPVTDANNDPVQPHTVVGEFNADFSDGSVAGAFGARKTME